MRKTGFNVFLGIGTALVTLYAGLWWATRPPHDDKPIDWVPIFEAEILPQGCETASRFLLEIANTSDPDDWDAAYDLVEAKGETCFDEKAYLNEWRDGMFLEGPTVPVALGLGAVADHWPHLTRGDLRTFSQLSKIDAQCIDQYRVFFHDQYFYDSYRESPAHIRATLDLYVKGANFATVPKADMVEHCRELIVETARSLAKRNDDGAQDAAIGALRDRHDTLLLPYHDKELYFDLATTEPKNGSYVAGLNFSRGPLCEEGQSFINTYKHEQLLAEVHSDVFLFFSGYGPAITPLDQKNISQRTNLLIEGYTTGDHALPQSLDVALFLALFAEEVGIALSPLAEKALQPIDPFYRARLRWAIHELLTDEYGELRPSAYAGYNQPPSEKLKNPVYNGLTFTDVLMHRRNNQNIRKARLKARSMSWTRSNRPVSICFRDRKPVPKCLKENNWVAGPYGREMLWDTYHYTWVSSIDYGYKPACLLFATDDGFSTDTLFLQALRETIDQYRDLSASAD
ncbi:MAG: hypothetical protein AAGF19_00360 [Pseudomonadota bacterium]